MTYVVCEVQRGLRESEVTASIHDAEGRTAFLRVERDLLMQKNGKHYLPVGVIHDTGEHTLIELPHEADSGANRLWVDSSRILIQRGARERSPA